MKRVGLIFPGQGAFHVGALRETRFLYPGVERTLAAVESVAERRFGRSLLNTIWNEKNNAASLLKTDPEILQLAIYALSVAAFKILQAEGIKHDVLMGHSFGEIAALTCAGVFTAEQGAEIVCDRVEALALAAPRDGRMAAVSAGRQKLRDAIDRFSLTRGQVPPASQLQIAVENSDFQTVVSGAREEIESFIPHCVELGLSAREINSPYAFHHPSLATAAVEFSRRLRHRASSAPNCLVYSPILGRYYQADDDFKGLLSIHLTQPVDFCSGIRRLDADGVGVYIECGALDALTKNVIRVLGPGNGKAFPTLGHDADDLSHVRRIVNHFKEFQNMNTNEQSNILRPDFDSFWSERSPVILSQLKAEFLKFLALEQPAAQAADKPMEPPPAAVAAPPNTVPFNGKAAAVISRDKMFGELVTIYADAMEYPHEVFKDDVELEAELGIDSVKQSEIIRRISAQYKLPPLPANFRAGDFKTMGQIVDFVFAHQGQATASAA